MAALRAAAAALLLAGAHAARRPADATPIGAVLTGIGDGDRSRPFIDLMRQARAFSTPGAPTDQNATVDAAGWPTQDFAMSVISGVNEDPDAFSFPGDSAVAGVYTVLARGCATLSLANTTSGGTVLNQTCGADGASFTAYVELTPAATAFQPVFASTRRTPASPLGSGLTNISILQPGYTAAQAQAQLFTDRWLAHLSRFTTLRFLAWSLNGTQDQVSWADRPTLDTPSWLVGAYGSRGAGVPWEAQIALANALGCDVWLNLPARVDDDYITQLAILLNQTLHPDATIVVEYSNEVWNYHFIGGEINQQLAAASVAAGDPYRFAYDGSNSSYVWGQRRHAWMTKHIGDLFRAVFGAGAVGAGKRVRPVLAGQGDAAAYSQVMFDYLSTVWGRPRELIGAATVAPYFGIPAALSTSASVDDLIAGLNASISAYDWSRPDGSNSSNSLAEHVALYRYYGLEFRGYEGGPATTGPSSPMATLWAKANATADPRMTGLIERLWAVWGAYGNSVLNLHQAGATTLLAPWGSFGVLWVMDVPSTPKTLALDAVRAAPPPPLSAGWPVPLVSHNASLIVGYYGPSSGLEYPLHWLPANTTLTYLLRSDAPGPVTWNVSLGISSTLPANTTALLEVSLGDGDVRTLATPYTGGKKNFVPMTWQHAAVPPGLSTLRLRVLTAFGYEMTVLNVTQA